MEQNPFTSLVTLADNPEPRCPCVLVLDTSASMGGEPIDALNRGVHLLLDELAADGLASKRVELALISFGGGVRIAADFSAPGTFNPPHFAAAGATPMGEAVVRALEMLEARKDDYRRAGLQYYRPWIFLITDGEPTDLASGLWERAVKLVHEGEAGRRLLFFGVAVRDANRERLNALCPPGRPSVRLEGLRFAELFRWLSSSLKGVSCSQPGTERLRLPSPDAWLSIDV